MKRSAITSFLIATSLLLTHIVVVPTDTTIQAGLLLPPGFKASIVAQGIEGARHMAVNKQGGLYIKLSRLKDGKGIIYLKDKNKDGIFDAQTAFGDYPGTGIYIRDNYLYA